MLQTTFPLRSKIIMLVGATAFCTALIIGGLNYYVMSRIAADNAIEKLAGETRLAALNVKIAYEQMKNDAFVISRTPPIDGIIQSMRNRGIDPRDGTTLGHWHRRLSTIFTSIIQVRPHYTQIRYIGIADNGRELVRVNRQPDGAIQVIEPEAMQEKGNEPFFQAGLKLHKDEYYFPKATYNRERGKVDSQPAAVSRVIIPVFDSYNTLFGMVVINLNYELFLADAIAGINIQDTVYLADNYGNFIRKYNGTEIGKLYLAEHDASETPPFIKEFVSNEAADGRFTVGDLVGYRHRLPITPAASDAYINAFVLAPRSKLFADANTLLNRSLTSGALLIAAAALAAALVGTRLTAPIAQMTASIRALGRDGGIEALDLPVHLRDEVGELARAFDDLKDWLALSDEHRKKLSTQLDAFVTNAVDGFIIINERGIIEKVNPALLDLFGYENDELVGRNVALLMPEPVRGSHDGFLQTYRRYIGTIRDEVGKRKDGTVFPIALSVSELQLADRHIFSAIIRDMTIVRLAQGEIERHAAELERSNKELDQFAYIAAHDLKAPLRVINNASRWLEEDLGDKLTGDDRENMTLLRNRVRRMEKLLDDLLDYSRLGKANDNRYEEIVDGHTMIDDLRLLLPPPSGVNLRFSNAFNTISVCRMPLQQVLLNLISNAIKHHDRDSGLIEIDAAQTEDGLRFSVRDDGPGIPSEFHETIFDLFLTLKPRDQVEGSGMGLALVKKIVKRAGGVITVTSDGERGTEFAFTWPAKRQSSQFSEKAA